MSYDHRLMVRQLAISDHVSYILSCVTAECFSASSGTTGLMSAFCCCCHRLANKVHSVAPQCSRLRAHLQRCAAWRLLSLWSGRPVY